MKNAKKITGILIVMFLCIGGLIFGQDRVISANQLPKTSKTFLTTHFKGVPVSSAIEDRAIYGVDEYKVYLRNGMKIEFDSQGNWKEVDGKHEKLPYSFIPASIRNYSTRNFPNTYIIKIEKKRWSYKAELSNGLELEFDRNGNFKKIDD
ncbi:PepSY-like domain-containing protein [Chryseobacterium sp. MEBOG06]|uniref:PepSY-like domain-containing protein n=1 Tax=Chryseobacterium sp. MEBOG06 TaxID=2879938 RepID=UPI001F33827F|nr:PepSY-like domain-containing protein [Chryseobacterium sp. MEBOG06]UKB83669.1 PepSY-like domain-containing protein [Chryseobacterium sp. MEBOG06]